MLGHYKISGKPAGANTTLVGGPDWDSDHQFSGDATGGLLVRDSTQPFGAGWITGVATGRVLVSGGVGVRPAWSAAPSLTSLTLSTPLAPGSGGTGLASYAVGDLLYASGAAALSKLADVAAGSVLVSGGVTTAPAWSATPSLTSLTLSTPLAGGSGGTGQSSYAVGDLLYASGAAALSKLADVAVGSVLVSGGITTAPAWSATPALTSVTLTTALSVGTNPSTTGAGRFANTGSLSWRNAVNGADIPGITVNASDQVSIASGGAITVFGSDISASSGSATIAAGGSFIFNGRARIKSPADSILTLSDAAAAAFTRLNFGANTSAEPALKRSGATLQVRLADDSAYADLLAATLTAAAGTATPAGGSTAARLLFGTTSGFGIYYGSGVPTVSAAQGSLYLRSEGSSGVTRAYINTNGTTGWTSITTAA